MPRFALFYTFLDFFKSYSFPKTVEKVAKYGSLRPSVAICSSQLTVSLGVQTTTILEPFNDRKRRGVKIEILIAIAH